MRVLIVVAFALFACVASEWATKTADEMKSYRTECLAALPAEYPAKLQAFEFPDVEPVRKFILCCGEKGEFFSDDEGWHVDRVAKQFKLNADDTAVVEKCADKNEQKSSVDVWAYRGHQCLFNSQLGERIKEAIRQRRAKETAAA